MISFDPPVGSELLGYRVEALLGQGGMGVVYLAEDLRLRRRVALKLLAPALAEDKRFRERFLAESKLAASLDHPCVIPIYEAGQGGGLLFIAMRYVEGGDLKALLRDGPLSAERVVRVCAQVADALDFAHERGLVHRDVKPSNVLLDGRDHVYLADFGLTKRLGEPESAEPGVLGTIDYAAPEQIRGEKLDGRADQYSLACLLFECLEGSPPFPRATDAAVLFAHLEETPPAPPGLEVVMQSGLAKAPEDRYGSCAALVLAAAEALGIVGLSQSPLRELPFALAGLVCPFKGLTFFDRADAEYFCGRERAVSEVVARAAASTLVGILGPSGIGKSSLLRAGVLPALSAGVLPGSAAWRQVLLRPGAHPGAELRRALGGDELDAAVARLASGERIVIAVDQLEELFTSCESEPERQAFLDQLAAAARDHDRRVLVLGSLRADFYGRLASYPAFAQMLSGDHVLVGPMDRDDLARAIVEPASRAGLEVEPALLDALVSDVSGEPGALPLLSTMLLELWQSRAKRTLRIESYRASGGVRGAVARLAERVFAELDERNRAAVQRVMLRLVSADHGALVRRRVPLAEIEQIDGANQVLATLTDARLLTVSDGAVEVSHEALLQEWPRYREWLEEDRVGRRLQAHLATSAREWDGRSRDPGELYRGTRLAGAEDWASQHADQLNALEREFLGASRFEAGRVERHRHAQNRRLRALAVGAGLLFVLASIAALFAERQKGSANQHRRTAQSLQLAASAEATLTADPELSALLALQGLRIGATDQAAQALRDALSQLRVRGTLHTGAGVTSAAFSPDGKRVATASGDGTTRIWSVDSHKQVAVLSIPAGVSTDNLAFSPDGRLIVTAQDDGSARIWSAGSHRQLAALRPRARGFMLGVAFSPDGRKIVTASADRSARIWSTTSHKQLAALPGPAGGVTPAFSPDGKQIITASGEDAGVRIFSASSYKQLSVMHDPGNAPVSSVAFSPDGRQIVTASTNGTARIWSARSHRQLATLTEPSNGRLFSAVFSPDGKEIVTASEDHTARVWSASTGRQMFVLAGHMNSVVSAAFGPKGLTVVTGSLDGTAKLWDAAPLEQMDVLSATRKTHLVSAKFIGETKRVVTVSAGGIARIWSSTHGQRTSRILVTPGAEPLAFSVSPDATQVVTIGQHGDARVWSADSHRQLGMLPVPDALFRTVAFSPDGAKIVTVSGGHVQIWSAGSHKRLGVLSKSAVASLLTVGFNRDGNKIAGLDEDGGVQIWSARSGRLLGVIAVPLTVGVNSAVFSPNGETIVTAGSDGTARIWSTTSRRQIGALSEPDSSAIKSASFSPDGTKIVTASADGTARVWSARTYEQLSLVTGPDNAPLNDAAFSADGAEIVTAGDDGTARIWSTELAGPAKAIERIAQRRVTRQLTPAERQAYLAGA